MPKTLLSHKEDLISPEEKELFYKGVREEFDHKLQEGSLDFSEMYQFVCDISFEQTDYNEKYSELGYFIDTNDLAHELIIKWMKLETNSITTEEFLFLLNESGNPHTYLGYLGSRLGEQFDKVFEAWYRGEDKASPEMLMFARVFGVDKLNEDKFKSRVTESMKVSFDDAVNFINKYLSF